MMKKIPMSSIIVFLENMGAAYIVKKHFHDFLYFLLSIYDHKKSTTFLFFVYGNECGVNFFNFNSLMHIFTCSKKFWFGIKYTNKVNGWIPS